MKIVNCKIKNYMKNPITLESTVVATDKGPLVDQTEDLMKTHYDEKIELFMGFLDTRYRAYTMAYYGESGSDKVTYGILPGTGS